MRRFDGEHRWFLLHAPPAKDSDGKVVQWYGTNTDIQDLKNAEAPVAAREKDLREIVNAIAQHIVVLDPEGESVRLLELVRVRPAIICFLRHFG